MSKFPVSSVQKQQAVAQALASVRAEGLKPSSATKQRLTRYANGEITGE